MSPLQWALLLFGALTIVAVYLYSRRDRRDMDRWQPNEKDQALVPSAEQQLDIFAGGHGASAGKFDQFGVGKPRRVAPSLDRRPSAPHDALADDEEQPYDEPEDEPAEGLESSPAPAPAVPPPSASKAPSLNPAPPPPPAAKKAEKLLSLLIAERQGNRIEGLAIHQALDECGLEFGARQIYHRLHDGVPVFSVASLLKPGFLIPDEAQTFSTPGLAMFMVLPGPRAAPAAIRDMLLTAQQLAKSLNAEVYDAKRKLLSEPAARALQVEVENWARLNLST